MSLDLTVGELIERLEACDRDAVVRLAVNPSFPYSHFTGDIVPARDPQGRSMVFLAEAGQERFLPLAVAQALAWHPLTALPVRARRGAGRAATGH